MESPNPGHAAKDVCPRCGNTLTAYGHEAGGWLLVTFGVVWILGGVLGLIAMSGKPEGLPVVAIGALFGGFWIWRGRYWLIRTTLRCSGCRYFRVVPRR